MSITHKANPTKYWLGKRFSEEHKQKMRGEKHSEKTKKTMSRNNWMKKHTGSLNPNWKGGCRKNERNDPAYHQWIKLVKKRDNNTCRINDENCKGYNIVHHIYSWSKYPKLRYKLSNGRALCIPCHKLTGNYGNKKK